ncbi:MAG: DUF4160 domain-containing protein [Blastocatellia bacterium]
MPTVLRKNGVRFQIFTDDYTPAHAHVFKAGKEVVINLGNDAVKPWVRENKGMKKKDEDQAVIITSMHQDYLLEQWGEIHG